MKMSDFQVKRVIFQEKMRDFGGKCRIFQEKMHDLGLNGGFRK